nr:MAG TPA: hypothetical protein [Caudoviricetes sp.]
MLDGGGAGEVQVHEVLLGVRPGAAWGAGGPTGRDP